MFGCVVKEGCSEEFDMTTVSNLMAQNNRRTHQLLMMHLNVSGLINIKMKTMEGDHVGEVQKLANFKMRTCSKD